jgi:hypothetical protein
MKGLGYSNCLLHNALDGVEVVLGLLGGLQHGLKSLLLMSHV